MPVQHDPNSGQFTSSGGKSYDVKSSSIRPLPQSKPVTTHVMTPTGSKVPAGKVVSAPDPRAPGKTVHRALPRNGGFTKHGTRAGAMEHVAATHEAKEAAHSAAQGKPAPWAGKSARDRVQMMHDMEHGKAMTAGDLVKRAPSRLMTAGELR